MTATLLSPAAQLRASTTATRVTFHWLGVTSKMEDDQKERMASVVEADCDSLSVSKRLYNNKLPVLKEITRLKGAIKDYWLRVTLPYVEPGVRLLKRTGLGDFNERMTAFQEQLAAAARRVQEQRDAILADARQRLQRAFNPDNYPPDLATLFNVEWSFPSIDPPNYLAQMSPEIFEQERRRAALRLEEAVALAENAFLQEFKQLVSCLHERLTPDADGRKKIFRDSAVTNLTEFFQRFKSLNIGSNEELDALVTQAQELVQGIEPADLRHGSLLRGEIATGLAEIGTRLAPLIVAKPRRHILRPRREDQLAPAHSA